MPSSPPRSPSRESERLSYHYTVRPPWAWVMQSVASNSPQPMNYVRSRQDLPSATLLNHTANLNLTATPNIQRRRSFLRKGPTPCTLRLEACTSSQKLKQAWHGTSAALDGLEDKDELVRTMQRCRCEHLGMSPPSTLIQWNVLKEELPNYVPTLPTLDSSHSIAVLKEPMGSSGQGIYFVSSHEDVFEHVQRHQQLAETDPEFLDNIMNEKGRMPAWVLQAEVYPPMLIQGGRKFHIRSNICIVEKLWKEELLDVYIHSRHEVKVASQPIEELNNSDDNCQERNVLAHITNADTTTNTTRVLLKDIEELAPLQKELELFLAKAFQAFMPDIIRRVGYSASQESSSNIQKFCMAGVDLMMTNSGRFYLLEVNVNPTAPPEEICSPDYKEHLVGCMSDLVDLIQGKSSPNFVDINDISPVDS